MNFLYIVYIGKLTQMDYLDYDDFNVNASGSGGGGSRKKSNGNSRHDKKIKNATNSNGTIYSSKHVRTLQIKTENSQKKK